ncbi:MAG TPA: hypothetical protein VEQ61_06270 [Thermoleophilaceae bacterium]|nr:hypothetical protein [Thermoleophilaceae bacterium]
MESVNGTISLRARTRPGADASVPIWGARRNAELLGRALERPVEVETAG